MIEIDMRLKRKLKRKDIYYDISNNEMKVVDVYENVLEESIFKKLIKSKKIWVWLICILIEIFGVINTSNKWLAAMYTFIAYTYGIFLYREIRKHIN